MKLTNLIVGSVIALATVAGSSNAASLLYRNDKVLGTDYLGAAITASAFAVSSTSGSLHSR